MMCSNHSNFSTLQASTQRP